MRKISLVLALIASLFALPAHADFTGKDAALATITFKNPGVCTAVVCVPVFQLYDGTNVVTLTTAGADAVSNTLTGQPVYSRGLVFNGTTWDRWQGGIKAASGAYASGSIASGAMVDLGAQADAACSTDNGSCSAIALIKRTNQNLTSYGSKPLDNSSVAINVSTATTTQLVAISASTLIYVTSFDVIAGGTGNITFVYGTGASCGTGTTSLTGAYPLTAQAGISKGSGIGTVLKVPAGNALCVTTSAAVQMSGSVSYQQF